MNNANLSSVLSGASTGCIVCGDALEVLRTMPDECIHCCVTSPPYWALRDYKTEARVWGGKAECEHEWGDEIVTDHRGSQIGKAVTTDARESTRGSFCRLCGAWRGSLGLEPTPGLYVEHIVEIFREVRRVLRNDGCCWINLGCSYASSSTHSSRSRPAPHESSCGTDDTEPRDSQEIDHACRRSDDEHRGGCLSRSPHISRIGRVPDEAAAPPCKTSRDSEQADSASASLVALPRGAPESTISSSSGCVPAACAHEATALACQPATGSSSFDASPSADMALCSGDTVSPDGTLAHHSSDTTPSCLASGSPISPYYTTALPPFKAKDLINIPFFVAEALRADGWYLRSMVPWVKRSAMPESCRDRPNSALEYVMLLAKSEHYYFDMEAVKKEAVYGYSYCPHAVPRTGRKAASSQICRSAGDRKEAVERGTNNRDKTYDKDSGRHWRNADLWFESIEAPHGMVFCDDELVGFDVNPKGYSGAHFAVMPEKLVEPMIKSGTSEKGVCPECGAPWRRVVGKGTAVQQHWAPGTQEKIHIAQGKHGASSVMNTGYVTEKETLGWRPGCKCGREDTVPALVLDPFMGVGTVGLVAQNLGRRWLGIELNPQYVADAERRIHGPLFASGEPHA